MPGSATGRVLSVDLTTGRIEAVEVPEEVYRDFLGGMGLGAWWLYTRMPAGADPLGPEAVLGFVPGLLTGSGSLYTGRWMAVCKSPLTGGWGDANCGGFLAPALKRSGYDGVFVSGVSEKPVYLYLGNGKAELRDASALWGLDAVETEERLQAELRKKRPGRRPEVAAIGRAGESLSLIAGIVSDGGRIAARSGVGAVMGSKRLKALVAAGTRPIPCADRDGVRARSAAFARRLPRGLPLPPASVLGQGGALLRKLPLALRFDGFLFGEVLSKWGTAGMNRLSVEWGDSPIRNWSGSEKDYPAAKSRRIDADLVLAAQKRAYHCYSCPTGCGGICEHEGKETHKPEYETILALSGLLLCDDLPAVFRMNERLNRAGMDSISAGACLAMALECAEAGLVPRELPGGLELRWGNAQAVESLLGQMLAREGLGAIFADGVKKAAERLGPAAAELAIHAGGQELAMHDPRNDPGFALHAAVDPSPGKHTVGCHLYYGMWRLWKRLPGAPRPPLLSRKSEEYEASPLAARKAVLSSALVSLFNAAGLCLFGSLYGVDRLGLFESLDAATGLARSPEDYVEAGLRIQTLRQLFSLREGIDPQSLMPSKRALGLPPKAEGANAGRSVPLPRLVEDYWKEIGWPSGRPSPETLERLGLAGLAAGAGAPRRTVAGEGAAAGTAALGQPAAGGGSPAADRAAPAGAGADSAAPAADRAPGAGPAAKP